MLKQCLISILNDPEFDKNTRFVPSFDATMLSERTPDRYFCQLLYAAGYIEKPTIIKNSDYSSCAPTLFRGSDVEDHYNLVFGEHYNPGTSRSYNGLYFAIASKENRKIRQKFTYYPILDAKLAEETQIIDARHLFELENEFNYQIELKFFNIDKFGAKKPEVEEIKNMITAGLIDQKKLAKLVHNDPAKLAILLGYDAIISNDAPWKQNGGVTELTLLNRGKLLISQENANILNQIFDEK